MNSIAVSGSNVYVGGVFTNVNNNGTVLTSADYVARWDGTSWSALGSGTSDGVYALALDGAGNPYAGGIFTTAGGSAANFVARWTGSWSAPAHRMPRPGIPPA